MAFNVVCNDIAGIKILISEQFNDIFGNLNSCLINLYGVYH